MDTQPHTQREVRRMTPRRRIGPHRDRPHYVIVRAYANDPPQLFEATSQNHRTRRLWARDMATDACTWVSMDDVIATHEDEAEARACFAAVLQELPALDRAVYRAQRDLEDAQARRKMTLKHLATGRALAAPQA